MYLCRLTQFLFVGALYLLHVPVSISAKIYFLHIPKCMGTTTHCILEKNFHEKEIFPMRKLPEYEFDSLNNQYLRTNAYGHFPKWFHKSDLALSLHAMSEYDSSVDNFELISGHFPLWFLENIDKQFEEAYLFTIVRDPIERALSEYRYFVKNNPSTLFTPLDVPANTMCKLFSSDPFLTGSELLQNCIENVAKFDSILFQEAESFKEDLLSMIASLALVYREKKLPTLNMTLREGISEDIIEKLKEKHSLDISLYQYLKENVQNTFPNYTQSKPSLSSLLKPQKEILYTFDMPMKGNSWHRRENTDTPYLNYQHIRDMKGKIVFSVEPNIDYTLQFWAMMMKDDIKPFIRVNGRTLYPKRKSQEEFSLYEVNIPRKLLIPKNENKALLALNFCADRKYAVNVLYPACTDTRELSFALNKIHIYPKST